MHEILDREVGVAFPKIFELGPGRQLTTILARINRKALASAKAIPC